MEQFEVLKKHNAILKLLRSLPRKMIELHGQDNLSEFVLHELCHDNCFNLSSIAYFVDNPDFDCLKGVSGISKKENSFCREISDVWAKPEHYSKFMQDSPFNQKVRAVESGSHKKSKKTEKELVDQVSKDLGLSCPNSYIWNMKHGNHGVILYETDNDSEFEPDDLQEVVHLLGFCPIS